LPVVLEKIVKVGYLNSENWVEIDKSLKAMKKQDNKLFWEKTFSEIERVISKSLWGRIEPSRVACNRRMC